MVTHRDRSPSTQPSLNILISTGEVSGDLQGSLLIEALHRQAALRQIDLEVVAVGGTRMAEAGATLLGNSTAVGSIGILEALPYLLPTLRLQRRIKQQLQRQLADLVIFLDYMNPNLSLGRFLRRAYPQLPTAYYIAPQQWVWAFSDQDTQALVNIADKMVAVFPQEAAYYGRFGADVDYFGHPLVDQFASPPTQPDARKSLGLAADAQVVTLLPASRQQEVKYILPILIGVAQKIQAVIPSVQFLVPISMPSLRPAIVSAIAESGINAQIIDGGARPAIAAADLVINKSGTVNLEVALMDVPQVVVYRLNPITARIAYYLLRFRVDYVSPVNLFVNRGIIPEFIQWEATVEAIASASLDLLQNADARATMRAGYADLREQMGQPGVCDRVANHLLEFALQRRQTAITSTASSDFASA